MAQALAASALVALAAWLLERAARARRWATRLIWVAAMGAMLAFGARAAHGGPGDDDSRLLLGLWALAAAFLAGVVVHAAFEGRRLRHGLEEREVAGARVLLTESVGPSAVGVLSPGILLPRWALGLDTPLLALVLRHEREHLAARDPMLLLAALAAVVLVPWNLPLWWAWRRLRLATEVDCDARVLRAHPDVRRYGELLLLTGQRAARPSWASLPMVTVAAPLRPNASHLATRIHAMTEPDANRSPLRTAMLLGASAVLAVAACALPRPRDPDAGRALVRIDAVGVNQGPDSAMAPILVYADGPARIGIDGKRPTALTDTLRLDRLHAMTVDVTDADVHIVYTGRGSIFVGGRVTGGAASYLTATGNHIILQKGGTGVGPQS